MRRYSHYSGPHSKIKSLKPAIILGLAAIFSLVIFFSIGRQNETVMKPAEIIPTTRSAKANPANPLDGVTFYVDDSRDVTRLAKDHPELAKIADQPGTTWLTGPYQGDTTGARDIQTIKRTSAEAAKTGSVNLYHLYAMPKRDACAGYSSGGFSTADEYRSWVSRLTKELVADAVFIVEADAVAHTMEGNCLSAQEINDRYALLAETVKRLQDDPKVIGVYLDAAHSEWFDDPASLVGPLIRAGVGSADGVTVNVSNFIALPGITAWSQRLVEHLSQQQGGKRFGVIIDTGRNGRGSTGTSVTGDERWCNPTGRGIGRKPSTTTGIDKIDAHAWIKNIGESDGDCRGNPPAGTFSLQLAKDLIAGAE